MHLQPLFKNASAYVNGMSEQLFQTDICFPSGTSLTIEDKKRIHEVILSMIKGK